MPLVLVLSDLQQLFDGEAHVDAADHAVADVLDAARSPNQNENMQPSHHGGPT